MQRYKVAIKTEYGIAQALRKYCNECGISVWSFLVQTITERLRKPLDFSYAEIEQKRKNESGSNYEEFYFGISDSIMQEKLRMIKDDYGISLNYFFVKTIAEKLEKLGCNFDDRSFQKKEVRKIKKQSVREKTDAEKMWESMNSMRNSFMEISMRKK